MSAGTVRVLLCCGIASGLTYLTMDVLAAAFFYPGYDYTAQQVSELSAIGAPSRAMWMTFTYPYTALTALFAAGVWMVAGSRPSLRVTAVLILLFAMNAISWGLLAPMHMRGTQFTDTDSLHIGFAVSAVLLTLMIMGIGSLGLGRRFRLFTAVLVLAMLAAGGVISTQIPAIAANQPTPWMGLVERISVYSPMLWLAVFAAALWRQVLPSGALLDPRHAPT